MDEYEKLQKQLSEMQQKADELYRQKKEAAIVQAKELIRTFKLTTKDLGIHVEVLNKGEPRFKQGIHFWTGKGRKPQWVLDHLAKGGTIDDLRIKP